ncbi:hypothetical protein [Deinococcus sp. KSM4-11]|uniref:glycoside hydrolase family 38 N-terminal domain-containing protein n=1 Tax=Deinococcus sp. KSM4-11 TaxID=2568654 RepID=UPI001454C095|nr:hypothetical protein [Deinococcus sp. KSM4-11]
MTGAERVHVVCTSHWDREWYLSAERFRFRLVQTIDAVLSLLEEHETYTFTLDGQAIVLEDYLQIRPEREGDLRRFLQGGRLRAGPWYVQPDEFLVSAEALRRNLRLGCQLVRDLGGEPVMVGYLPDAFGHLAALPALLRGEGVDAAIFTRGTSAAVNALGDLFWWTAPGGETVLAHREPIGYGMTLAEAAPAATTQLQRAVAALQAEANSPELLVQLGSDHSRPQRSVPTLIAGLGAPFVFSDHQRYVQAVRAAQPELPTYRGELRSGEFHPLLSGTLSARLYLKQRNFALDDRLRFSTEPLLELAAATGPAPAPAFLRRAWTLLIRNHPHDSICGCSVDDVHDEMDVRSQQAEGIAEELEHEALTRLAGGPHAGHVLVLNPQGAPRVQLRALLTRAEAASAGLLLGNRPVTLTHVHSALVSTLAGPVSALPEWLEQLHDRHPIRTLAWTVDGDHLTAEVDEGATHPDCPPVEAMLNDAIDREVRTVELRVHRTEATVAAALVAPQRVQALPLTIVTASPLPGTHAMDNGRLRVDVEPAAGTLAVTDLASGRVWGGLHALQDVGDRGDTYTFSVVDGPVLTPVLVASTTAPLGAAGTRLDLTYDLTVPGRLAPGRAQRSAGTVRMTVTTQVILWADAAHLEFRTTFVNAAEDHRLRVHFPGTGEGSHADSADVVVFRPERLPGPDTAAWADQPTDQHPLAHWAAKPCGDGYWGVAARGLSEYGHLGGLSLTLVRAVGWLSRDDLPERPSQAGPPYPVPGAQCQRPITAEYAWLAPHASLDALGAAALAYAHPARAWVVPAAPRGPV